MNASDYNKIAVTVDPIAAAESRIAVLRHTCGFTGMNHLYSIPKEKRDACQKCQAKKELAQQKRQETKDYLEQYATMNSLPLYASVEGGVRHQSRLL